ncbi:DUF397 domain-containing protein [Nocardiopsis sp. NPDC050513]|uniref:DUF397 domain-containing protein n=1 Tax=Nocardiopsis sp. NPDC050513 TaxID=3364338 RepID=UPI0037B5BD82
MLTGQEWRKSSYSGPQGCVQARRPDIGVVEIGDTTRPHGPTLLLSRSEWTRFLLQAKTDT